MSRYEAEHDYTAHAVFAEVVFGFAASNLQVDNLSETATLEVSGDGETVYAEIAPGERAGLGWDSASAWLRRAEGSGDPDAAHTVALAATRAVLLAAEDPAPAPAPDPLLPILRVDRFASIDARTRELIARGFRHAGLIFSLSERAQIYWTNMFVARDMLTYPLRVNTLDDLARHDVVSASEVEAMYRSAIATVKDHLGSGTALKDQIRVATDVAAVMAVVDARGL